MSSTAGFLGQVAPTHYVRYLRRIINTLFFSLTMDIRDAIRTAFMLRQGEGATVASRQIRQRRHASLPLEQIRLDQHLGKSLDNRSGRAASRNFHNTAHRTPTALR
jgi:hypothetical protein